MDILEYNVLVAMDIIVSKPYMANFHRVASMSVLRNSRGLARGIIGKKSAAIAKSKNRPYLSVHITDWQ